MHHSLSGEKIPALILSALLFALPAQAQSGNEMLAGVSWSGFVDASYVYDAGTGMNTFGVDQFEIDLTKDFGGIGSFRADIEWVNDGMGGFTLALEQGYVTFSPESFNGTTLTFGQFNAPIGFELLDPNDMYQFSHALVFDYGLPTNLTGAMVTAPLGETFDIALYLVNGWDQNVDPNKGKTVGGRLGFSFGEKGGAGLSAAHGDPGVFGSQSLTVIDIDLTLTPTETVTLGAEFNTGRDVNILDVTNTWMGLMAMGHVDFASGHGVTGRVDFFNDPDALRLGTGVAEARKAVTIAPTFSLGENMGALAEIRFEFSDQDVFLDSNGAAVGSSTILAFEMTYSF
ncbi:MAG: porin [Gemmatimonadota bacterium]|nr:porin [Gemmatimonadota bacterium]